MADRPRFKDVFVHETALVEPNVRIGRGTKIWHYVHVRSGARIGRNCTIGRNVYVDTAAVIGNGVKIQNNVSVYEGVRLADDVFVGPNVSFTNDLYPRSFPNGWKKVATIVRRGASFGANATVLCGITVGRYAMIGAGALVTSDVPAFALVRSEHSHIVGKVDRAGAPVKNARGSRQARPRPSRSRRRP